jgi:hypothetical protein
MLDGIQFKADGTVERCGTAIQASEWIEPMLFGNWTDCLYEAQAADTKDIAYEDLPLQAMFDFDMAESMVNIGMGHDPYNHVGISIVAICIGRHIVDRLTFTHETEFYTRNRVEVPT